MASFELKSFAQPDDVREFPFGRGEIVDIGGGHVMRMTLQAGWRWSDHVKPAAGTELCLAPHFQYLLSGTLRVRTADGTEFEVRAGDVNLLPPGHDAWVVGNEPVEAIDWGGAHIWGRADVSSGN
jgi:quercetin dioxygenase-like cupin family protein